MRRISLLYAAGDGRAPAEEGVSPSKTMGRALKEEPSRCQCKCGCRTKMASSNLCTSCGHRVCCEVCMSGEACEITVRLCHVCSGEQAELPSGAGATCTSVLQDGSSPASPFATIKPTQVPPPAPPGLPDARLGRRRAQLQGQGISTCTPCPTCGRACVGEFCALKGEYCTCSIPHMWRSKWVTGQRANEPPVVIQAASSAGLH